MADSRQTVHCPTCRAPVAWDAERSPWRPFCSKRCKLIDLGAWFNEENTIPGIELPEELLPDGDHSADDEGHWS